MRIAVIGAGAIGGLTAGYLKLKGYEVTLVGRRETVEAIQQNGLVISGVRGNFKIEIAAAEKLTARPDLAILAVKTQDVDSALRVNAACLGSAPVVTAQNGVRADAIAARYLPKENIVSSIVMFGATSLAPGEIVHNFENDWIIGPAFGSIDNWVDKIKEVLSSIFPVVVSNEIRGMKYLKVFVNSNNCIPALLGSSMQESFADLKISRLAIAIWKEGLTVVRQAGINLVSLPDFPLERIQGLTVMPAPEAAKIFSGIMLKLSKEPLYGSILQSIRRGKISEIDYLNGEFAALAKEHRLQAPLNEKLTSLVHKVEQSGKFFKPEELLAELKGLLAAE